MRNILGAIPKCENCNSVKNLYLKLKTENEKLEKQLEEAEGALRDIDVIASFDFSKEEITSILTEYFKNKEEK